MRGTLLDDAIEVAQRRRKELQLEQRLAHHELGPHLRARVDRPSPSMVLLNSIEAL